MAILKFSYLFSMIYLSYINMNKQDKNITNASQFKKKNCGWY